MRVLVVEDDAHARRALTAKLHDRGHEVVECVSGEQALALHAARPFPLLLIDWVLPGMDGLGLCRKLRSLSNNFSAVPVIVFTTARNSPYDLERGLDAGADDFLVKGRLARLIPSIDRARREVRRWNEVALGQSLIAAAEADEAVKGGGRDPVYAIEWFVSEVSRLARVR